MGSIPVIRKNRKIRPFLRVQNLDTLFKGLKSSLGEMVNTADLKSAPLRVIGSIPIVSRVKSFENLKASSLTCTNRPESPVSSIRRSLGSLPHEEFQYGEGQQYQFQA